MKKRTKIAITALVIGVVGTIICVALRKRL